MDNKKLISEKEFDEIVKDEQLNVSPWFEGGMVSGVDFRIAFDDSYKDKNHQMLIQIRCGDHKDLQTILDDGKTKVFDNFYREECSNLGSVKMITLRLVGGNMEIPDFFEGIRKVDRFYHKKKSNFKGKK